MTVTATMTEATAETLRAGVVSALAAVPIQADKNSTEIDHQSVQQFLAASQLLDLAHRGLASAACERRDDTRYSQSHLAALRAAAAVLALRSSARGAGEANNVWKLLAKCAPELAEWAMLFEFGSHQRARIAHGTAHVSTREADDLLRDAVAFIQLVERILDLRQ